MHWRWPGGRINLPPGLRLGGRSVYAHRLSVLTSRGAYAPHGQGGGDRDGFQGDERDGHDQTGRQAPAPAFGFPAGIPFVRRLLRPPLERADQPPLECTEA